MEVQDFEADVIRRSREIPVVVDFWAEWCGPCRVLGPVLERLALGEEDNWILAKVNVDDHQDIAMRYGVSGIPAVKMFIDGVPAGEFVGAMPEQAVRQWLSRTLPGKHGKNLEEVRELLSAGKNAGAEKILRRIVAEEPGNSEAGVLLARLILFDDSARALELVRDVTDPKVSELAEAVTILIRLSELGRHPERLAPDPVKGEYLGAIGKFLAGDFDGALSGFIGVIRTNRYYDEDGSRKACIAIFKYLGEDHPVTLAWRREFSSALY